MTTGFVPTPTNMEALVRNIIQGYRMGPIRALAQEPVQNSKDARLGSSEVGIEYRLHERVSTSGDRVHLLTITDWNTTGLQGPIRSSNVAQGSQEALPEGYNWAAFEGMGYTRKSNEDALGSRGQGKAAYLYHSDLNMMLYDTLLPGGEYRLGVRRASPSDSVLQPPFRENEARTLVQTQYDLPENEATIQLGLTPLNVVGTRVIVPHLSQAALTAFHSGELYGWIQRCWWRAIQIGMTVTLVDEQGMTQTVTVPSWWQGEPWDVRTENLLKWERLGEGEAIIKRIVLFYDADLEDDDNWADDPQFCGVQLLRGQQWIETLPIHDYVHRDKRAGFRGFVEFDQRTEKALIDTEAPQHDQFNKRMAPCNVLVPMIRRRLQEFAEHMGWADRQRVQAAPGRERDAGERFLRFFSRPRLQRPRTDGDNGGVRQSRMWDDPTYSWNCDLTLQFPNSHTTRINYGEFLRDVTALVTVAPQDGGRLTEVRLSLSHEARREGPTAVAIREIEVWDGTGRADFGDFQIIRGAPSLGRLQCAQEGKWRLTAEAYAGGTKVASDSRILYVQEDPPSREAHPYTLSISAVNHSRQQTRIDSGDTLGIQVNVKNNTPDNVDLEVTVTLGDTAEGILSRNAPVNVAGTPAGEPARRIPAFTGNIVVNPLGGTPPGLSETPIELPPGAHRLSADLYIAGNDRSVAHASKTIYVDQDPALRDNSLPFDIQQSSGIHHPRWQFNKDDRDYYILLYSPSYPLYAALSPNKDAFVEDVCAEGLIEWALDPVNTGDDTRLDELLNRTPEGVEAQQWDDFCDKMRELASIVREPGDLSKTSLTLRECAAKMLSMYRPGG